MCFPPDAEGTRIIEWCQLRCGAVAKAAAMANVTQDLRCLSCLQNLSWPQGLGTTTIVPYHQATVWGDTPMNAATSPLIRYVRSDIRLTATKVFGHSVRIGHGNS